MQYTNLNCYEFYCVFAIFACHFILRWSSELNIKSEDSIIDSNTERLTKEISMATFMKHTS